MLSWRCHSGRKFWTGCGGPENHHIMRGSTPARGYSSAGRALAWHARGQRFDPAYLHQSRCRTVRKGHVQVTTLSSRGLGHHPFTVSTGVRIPVGSPDQRKLTRQRGAVLAQASRRGKLQPRGVVVQLVRIPACHAGGRGFESRPLRQVFAVRRRRKTPTIGGRFAFRDALQCVTVPRHAPVSAPRDSTSFLNFCRFALVVSLTAPTTSPAFSAIVCGL